MVQYHLYDIASGMASPFGERSLALLAIVRSLDNPSLVYVKTEAVESVAAIDAVYDRYMDDGYEGQIIRLNQPYENKRSKTLLKRKDFIDEEFEIMGIEEGNGNWSGYAKRLKFKLKDGRSCGAGIAGDQAFTKIILERRKELLGRLVTVRYFKPTPDGMPRFPVAVDFHGAEGRVD